MDSKELDLEETDFRLKIAVLLLVLLSAVVVAVLFTLLDPPQEKQPRYKFKLYQEVHVIDDTLKGVVVAREWYRDYQVFYDVMLCDQGTLRVIRCWERQLVRPWELKQVDGEDDRWPAPAYITPEQAKRMFER